MSTSAHHRLHVGDLAQLVEHEPEILRRIAATPNGGNLFVAHPFLCLADLGVDLSDDARAEIVRRQPGLSALSETAYRALRCTTERQPIRFHLVSLFGKEAQQ